MGLRLYPAVSAKFNGTRLFPAINFHDKPNNKTNKAEKLEKLHSENRQLLLDPRAIQY